MKFKLLTTIVGLLASCSLALGQAGVGALGLPYVDYKNSQVDFGTFSITKGNLTGTYTMPARATIALSAAELIALYTTPKLLIDAPGAGKSIAVVKMIFTITRSSTAFTGGGAVIVQYGSTVNGGGLQALDSTFAATVITGAAGTANVLRNGAVISDSSATTNAGLYMSAATAVFAAGTGTAVADVWYVVN